MSELIVGRHAETIFNYENIFSGCMDIPLSSDGINRHWICLIRYMLKT